MARSIALLHRRSVHCAGLPAVLVCLVLTLTQTMHPQGTEDRNPTQSRDRHTQRKELRGRVTLASGDLFCIHVPLHTARPVNLGAAQLTVTVSPEKPGSDSVGLVAKLTKTTAMLTSADSDVELCGTVPPLSERQAGAYHASEYAIHLGSGSAANLGAPDDRMIDTAALAQSLELVRLILVR